MTPYSVPSFLQRQHFYDQFRKEWLDLKSTTPLPEAPSLLAHTAALMGTPPSSPSPTHSAFDPDTWAQAGVRTISRVLKLQT